MINISIDLSKIDKTRIKEGKNGAKYFNLTVDEKREPDQFGNTHTVYQTPTKEEREAKKDKVYLGSGKEFKFNNSTPTQPAPSYNTPASSQPETIDDGMPF